MKLLSTFFCIYASNHSMTAAAASCCPVLQPIPPVLQVASNTSHSLRLDKTGAPGRAINRTEPVPYRGNGLLCNSPPDSEVAHALHGEHSCSNFFVMNHWDVIPEGGSQPTSRPV